MAYEMLMQEAQGMSEAALMEVVRFMRFIKGEAASHAESIEKTQSKIREAGLYRGKIVMSDNFDTPLEDFKEYMQ